MSVAAPPWTRSTMLNCPESAGAWNGTPAGRAISSYRPALAMNAAIASASSRPRRHQPGQSSAATIARF